MAALTYQQKLLDPRWQKLRLQVLERENFTCQYCGEQKKTLHVHHIVYPKSRDPWDIDHTALLCLCDDCHKVEHLKNLTPTEKKIIDAIQFRALLLNGDDKLFNIFVKEINSIFFNA